jgi:hypothetical protein
MAGGVNPSALVGPTLLGYDSQLDHLAKLLDAVAELRVTFDRTLWQKTAATTRMGARCIRDESPRASSQLTPRLRKTDSKSRSRDGSSKL